MEEKTTEKKLDITNFEEAVEAIVKHMTYPATDEEKRAFFIRFYEFAVTEM